MSTRKLGQMKACNTAPGALEFRVRGAWLARSGFNAGDAVEVITRSPGVIEIRAIRQQTPEAYKAAALALDQAMASGPVDQVSGPIVEGATDRPKDHVSLRELGYFYS